MDQKQVEMERGRGVSGESERKEEETFEKLFKSMNWKEWGKKCALCSKKFQHGFMDICLKCDKRIKTLRKEWKDTKNTSGKVVLSPDDIENLKKSFNFLEEAQRDLQEYHNDIELCISDIKHILEI